MTDHGDLVAAFLAKGGKVAVVQEGASNGMTTNDWKYAVRGELSPKQRRMEVRYEDDESAHERYREAVNDAYMTSGSQARDEVMSMGVHSFRKGR
jgi:hypothetical protein